MLSSNFPDRWPEEREKLLQKKLGELGLKLEGSRLEKLIDRLYEELEGAKIKLRPKVYLSDEWGCPDGIPMIGIPFYLVDEKLSRIEDEIMEGIKAETDEEIMRYLRHESGHAFNYAYKLYETEEWSHVFGPASRPYREDYRPHPFSVNFVRHIAGWYAQKHPDEDFAETFAVWLTPDSHWRENYKGWGCSKKLLYVDKVVPAYGSKDPLVTAEGYDVGVDLSDSLTQHYEKFRSKPSVLPPYFDGDLKVIFERKLSPGKENDWLPADQFLVKHRRSLVRNINSWTGLNDSAIKSLMDHLAERSKSLDLYVNPDENNETLTEFTAYATALCMNKLYKGDFIIK